MSSAELKSLLAPPSEALSVKHATALLDAHFTSIDSLDELESLVADAQSRQTQLDAELSASSANLRAFITQTRSEAGELLSDAKELSLERHSLADELSELSSQLVSVMSDEETQPTLLEDLKTLHRNLKELESVRNYVLIVRHALHLRESALEQLRGVQIVSKKGLTEYEQLVRYIGRASETLGSVEDGAGGRKLYLVVFLEDVRDKTWRDMKSQLTSSLLEAAEKLGWPMQVDYAACDPESRRVFEKAFIKLLHLQQLKTKVDKEYGLEATESGAGLYPIEALVHPIALRFKFHFDGARQTNRLDKPEWYFTHILNIAHEHRHFMDTAIQHLLAAGHVKNISAWREYALLLLNIISRKLRKTVPSLLARPSLFAHTIHQALLFDAAYIQEGFQLQNTSAQPSVEGNDIATWEGTSAVILGNPAWFSAWLQAEKQFVDTQYIEIISAQDAWSISADDVGDDEQHTTWDVRPTNSARRIKALFNQITDRFSPLPSPLQKARFLISVQLPLLDAYRGRIASSLDAFETLSNAFLRAVPGALSLSLSNSGHEGSVNVDPQNLTSGVGGVQWLCKALISASYIRASLEAWAEETFFLELWQDMLIDPAIRNYAEETSLPLPAAPGGGGGGGSTVFDDAMAHYSALIRRGEDMSVHQICGEIEAGIRSHLMASTGITPGLEPSDGIGISQSLLKPLALLSSDLTFLRGALPQTVLTALYRRIAGRLAEHILQRQILYRGSFSRFEGAALQAECELWVETCHTALGGRLGGGRQRVEAPWAKLLQAARLVGADGAAWETATNATFGTVDEDSWEQTMLEITNITEMSRDEVSSLLRRRDDCP